MKTRVFRIDLSGEDDIVAAIVAACEKQLGEGFKLASTFVWATDLLLVFQAVG